MFIETSAQYLEGIKEGRELIELWKREGIFSRNMVQKELDNLEEIRNKSANLANSSLFVDFFKGEYDFLKHHLAKAE